MCAVECECVCVCVCVCVSRSHCMCAVECVCMCVSVWWYGRRAVKQAAGQLQQSQLWQWCGPTTLLLNGHIQAGGDLATDGPPHSCHCGSWSSDLLSLLVCAHTHTHTHTIDYNCEGITFCPYDSVGFVKDQWAHFCMICLLNHLSHSGWLFIGQNKNHHQRALEQQKVYLMA